MFQHRRIPQKEISLQKKIFYSICIAAVGLLTGVMIKFLDIYTTNLGNVFSQMSVWIFICCAISVYSRSPKRAAVNVFLFCAGMLVSYYVTAEVMKSNYSFNFVYGWAVFCLFTPLFAVFTWHVKGKSVFSKLMTAIIIAGMLGTAMVLFDKISIFDIIFAVLTAVVLLF